MSFHSGRVSFVRFQVNHADKPPTAVTQALLDTLSEHAFTDTPVGTPDEIESGWTTGQHLFDLQFTFDKNGFGNALLFALRIDTNRVPGDVRQAYRLMHEQSLAATNPSGFISKAQKKDAREAVEHQIHEELASGKYRRSKLVPLLWDLQRSQLYCAAAGNTVQEQLASCFRTSFNADLTPLTAGSLAGQWLREWGKGRDYEDLRPSPFTVPPPEARSDGDDAAAPADLSTPPVPWAASAVDVKDFLGNEFLLWMWWVTETAEGQVDVKTKDLNALVALVLDRTLEMDCAWGATGKQTLRGAGPTRLAEAGDALRTGKWPRKAGMILSDGQQQWELTFQADRLAVSAGLLPPIETANSPRELLEQRLTLTRDLSRVVDGLYETFLRRRVSSSWASDRQKIHEWIGHRRRR